MGRPPLTIDVTPKDQKELTKLLSGGVQQVRVVLRALALLQLARGETSFRLFQSRGAGDGIRIGQPLETIWRPNFFAVA